MARKAVFLWIVMAWIGGCASSPVERPDAARSYLGQAAFTCLVDSSLYSHSHSPVEDGAEVGFCRRNDDGWYFLLREDAGFIAYTGPVELPLAVVGMSCE